MTESKTESAFMDWKPVAYSSSERIIANTLDVINSNPEEVLELKNSTILMAFFGNNNYSAIKFNMTFGSPDDQNYYYDDKKYISFSFVVGLGSPPEQQLSFLVQMIILVGFGLPVLVMVISALYLIVRKIRKTNREESLLNEESFEESNYQTPIN